MYKQTVPELRQEIAKLESQLNAILYSRKAIDVVNYITDGSYETVRHALVDNQIFNFQTTKLFPHAYASTTEVFTALSSKYTYITTRRILINTVIEILKSSAFAYTSQKYTACKNINPDCSITTIKLDDDNEIVTTNENTNFPDFICPNGDPNFIFELLENSINVNKYILYPALKTILKTSS